MNNERRIIIEEWIFFFETISRNIVYRVKKWTPRKYVGYQITRALCYENFELLYLGNWLNRKREKGVE